MRWFSFGPSAQELFKNLPVIDRGLCTGCGLCIAVCPHACLEFDWSLASLKNPATCTSEGRCVEACPESLIAMKPHAAP